MSTVTKTFDLPYGEIFKTKHSTKGNWAIAESGLVFKTHVGSGLLGLAIGGTDDIDHLGICLEPPECVIGMNQFEQYEFRTQPDGVRSGPGDLDLVCYCHTPESRVLTSSLEWRRIDSLKVGDRVISFDEGPNTPQRHRHFSTGTVTAMQSRMAEVVEVETSEGVTRVTPDHPFLVRRDKQVKVDGGKTHTVWINAGDLQPGDKIYSLPVWDEDLSHGGGYLAGQYDGEASLSLTHSNGYEISTLSWAQNSGPEVVCVEQLLAERGFKTRTHASKRNRVVHVHVAGDWSEQMRLLGSVRPRRLLRHPRLERLWEGRSLQTCGRATVKSVTPLGIREIIAMETDTHTYIADGLLGHNSLRKFARLAAGGNPTVLITLWAPDDQVLFQNEFGRQLRSDPSIFLSREAGLRFAGYLESQKSKLLGERSQRTNRPELIKTYGFDCKFAYHAVRLGIQGIEILTTGRLNLPMAEPGATWLRELRVGMHTLDETIEKIGELQYLLRHLVTSADLPQRCDMSRVNKLLVEMYQQYWSMRPFDGASEYVLVG